MLYTCWLNIKRTKLCQPRMLHVIATRQCICRYHTDCHEQWKRVTWSFWFPTQVLLSCHTQPRIAESTRKHTPVRFSSASSTARRSAVRCRAVSCCAVLCRAVQRFLFRTYQTTTLASIPTWRGPACMSSSILYGSLHFPYTFNYFLVLYRYVYSYKQQYRSK